MNSKILVVPGSFNPITNAHVEMIKKAADKVCANKVYIIPAHDSYVAKKGTLIPSNARYDLIEKTTPYWWNCISYEIDSMLPMKTYDTISKLEFDIEYGDKLIICLGMDNIKTLTMWYNWQKFVEENQFVACVRNRENLEDTLKKCGLENYKDHFIEIEIPENNISSSLVRKLCEEGKFDEVKDLVPKNVYKYLKKFYARII